MRQIGRGSAFFVRRALRNPRGLALSWPSLLVATFFTVCGLAVCVGRADSSDYSLEFSADTAVLTEALPMPDFTTAPTPLASLFRKSYSAHNVAIIVESTASMNTTNRQSRITRLAEVLAGVRTMLTRLTPCQPSESACRITNEGNITDTIDQVSLFTFPNIAVETVENEYNCANGFVSVLPYTFPRRPQRAFRRCP